MKKRKKARTIRCTEWCGTDRCAPALVACFFFDFSRHFISDAFCRPFKISFRIFPKKFQKRSPPPHPFRNQLTDECFYMKKKFWFKSMSPKAKTYIYAYSQKVKTMFTYFIDLAESLKPFSLPLSSCSKCMRLFLLQMH